MSARRGRPLQPLDPDASARARLGAELRGRRLARKLTQQGLAVQVGYTAQYISEAERAKTPPTRPFIAACDSALDAHGTLLLLLPAALEERELQRQERAAARRAARNLAPLPCGAHCDAGVDADVNPTNRRDLIGAAGATALGAGLGTAVPSAAREVDPELPAHWDNLLNLLGRHDERYGPRDVLGAVLRELRLISAHRAAARGELRLALMRGESRWSRFAAWLSHDAGDMDARDALIERALRLAREASFPDMLAFARSYQSLWAAGTGDAGRATALAGDALRFPGTSAQTRAWCALRAAHGHALAGERVACEHRLVDARDALGPNSSGEPMPWAGDFRITHAYARTVEARCWFAMQPSRAIPLYESALREHPHDEIRDYGLHLARLALVCAATGERDRAEAEGRKAAAIYQRTQSSDTARELKRLGQTLKAA